MAEPENIGNNQPQRLQSLSSRGRGLGRGGRFLPNAVNRRSQKDRESSAPAIKPQQPQEEEKKLDNRDRRRKKLGIRAEAAGPLAAPTIAAPVRSARSQGTRAGGSEFASQGGSVKSEEALERMQAQYIVGDDGRVDMVTGGLTDMYFPVTVPTDSHHADIAGNSNDSEKTETSENPENPENPENSENPENPENPENLETSETSETSKTSKGSKGSETGESNSTEESEEFQLNIDPDCMYLVQLPAIGLETTASADVEVEPQPQPQPQPQTEPQTEPQNGVTIKSEDIDAPMADVTETSENTESTESTGSAGSSGSSGSSAGGGRLGTLRTHASGKTTLMIGDAVYELMPGAFNSSIEDVLMINIQNNSARSLGSIKSRDLVVPDLASLGF